MSIIQGLDTMVVAVNGALFAFVPLLPIPSLTQMPHLPRLLPYQRLHTDPQEYGPQQMLEPTSQALQLALATPAHFATSRNPARISAYPLLYRPQLQHRWEKSDAAKNGQIIKMSDGATYLIDGKRRPASPATMVLKLLSTGYSRS